MRRLECNPLITPDMFPGDDGANINGPSVIEAPDWLPDRLGRFYMYFSHHGGTYIRLAYADEIGGPWRLHEPGALNLSGAAAFHDHVASPDVHVIERDRQILMFFHSVSTKVRKQLTYVARSWDGVNFLASPSPVADFYFRTVRWRRQWLGMSKGGVVYISRYLSHSYRRLRNPVFPMRHPLANAAGDVRHVALAIEGDLLVVYFSRIGDAPESIMRAEVDLSRSPANWRATNITTLLRPEADWEGGRLPVTPSSFGAATARENALRDPAVFRCDDKRYLFYVIAGESGVAVAELDSAEDKPGP